MPPGNDFRSDLLLPPLGPGFWGGVDVYGASYQLAVALVVEQKLSSAVDRLSTAAINEV